MDKSDTVAGRQDGSAGSSFSFRFFLASPETGDSAGNERHAQRPISLPEVTSEIPFHDPGEGLGNSEGRLFRAREEATS